MFQDGLRQLLRRVELGHVTGAALGGGVEIRQIPEVHGGKNVHLRREESRLRRVLDGQIED